MANHLYGPSYISASSALSFWGLIPEKVNRIQSFTTKVGKLFKTSLVSFEYTHCKQSAFFIGLKQVSISNNQTVLMASPEKAIVDLITQTTGINLRSINQTIQFLKEDQRIDMAVFFEMDLKIFIDCVLHCPKKQSLEMLVKTLQAHA